MRLIVKIKYLNDYIFEIEFNNGIIKFIDFSKILGEIDIFKLLKNIDCIINVSIDSCGNTICWDNGADICSDVLYYYSE